MLGSRLVYRRRNSLSTDDVTMLRRSFGVEGDTSYRYMIKVLCHKTLDDVTMLRQGRHLLQVYDTVSQESWWRHHVQAFLQCGGRHLLQVCTLYMIQCHRALDDVPMLRRSFGVEEDTSYRYDTVSQDSWWRHHVQAFLRCSGGHLLQVHDKSTMSRDLFSFYKYKLNGAGQEIKSCADRHNTGTGFIHPVQNRKHLTTQKVVKF